ncbi:MAG: endonuclease/exonuclease/phosphatase family protein [Alkalispirochaeta sp.]
MRVVQCSRVVILAGVCAVLSACSSCRIVVPDDESLTVVAYNVENLFDARANGNEYEEFLPEAGWNERDVERRLQSLGAALHGIEPAPDVLVVSEIENAELLDRLVREYAVDLPLEYRAWVGGAASATGVAIASRYPIVTVRSLLARSGDVPALRPIMEARLRLPESDLVVFANHWKSKRGGAAATEPLRRATARLLSSRIAEIAGAEPDLPVLIAGDLNEQPRENEYIGAAYPTALMEVTTMREWDDALGTDPPPVGRAQSGGSDVRERVPPWFTPEYRDKRRYLPITREVEQITDRPTYHGVPVLASLWSMGDDPGSYSYFGRWERIDHLLANASAISGPAITFREFRTVAPKGGVDEEGTPVSWQDDGVSDHLPIMAVFDRRRP